MSSAFLLLLGSSPFTNGSDFQGNWRFSPFNRDHEPFTQGSNLWYQSYATHIPEVFYSQVFFPWGLEKQIFKKTPKTRTGKDFKVYISVMLEIPDFWWRWWLLVLVFLLHFLGQNIQSLNLFSYLWRCYLLTTYNNTKI